jgi:hypothetical protein
MTTLTLSQPGSSDFPALFTAIGSDGQKYFYATKEYIDRGFVDDGKQTYPLFALRNPNVFDTASLVKLPSTEGLGEKAKKVYSNPTEGYLWKQSDFLKATGGAIPQPTYQITADRPAIQGMVMYEGQPTYAVGATSNSDASFILPNENLTGYKTTITQSGGNFLSNFVNNLVGGDIGKAFASIDPSAAISRAATNLFQPVEQTVSKELAQLDKDLSLSENTPALAAIALSVAAPGVGSAIGQQMIAAGLLPAATSAAVASAIGTGVANAALQVAQGKSAEDALKGAVVGGVAGFAGGQVGDYLVADPGAVKNFVSSTAANMVAGKDPETAAKTALVQTGIQGTADVISTAQAEKYIENLPIPDYLSAGPATTSADVMATFPETNPANFVGPPTDIDTTLLDLSTAAPTTQTYTYEDGSTLTVDETGGVVGYTDATETPYKGTVDTPDSPLTKAQIEGMIKLGLTVAGASAAANAVQDAISSGGDTTTQTGFPFTPSDISGWARPEYTQTWQAPLDLNSLFTTDNLLSGTQWAGLQGNQFANIPQVSMSDFISSIQNGKV